MLAYNSILLYVRSLPYRKRASNQVFYLGMEVPQVRPQVGPENREGAEAVPRVQEPVLEQTTSEIVM